MIGSVIQIGLNMAAYALSEKAVIQSAKYASSAFKQGAKAANRILNTREVVSPGFTKAALKLTANEGRQTREFFTRSVQAAKTNIEKRTSPAVYKMLGDAGNLLKQEAHFLPANYIYYKMEKHRSVSQEDKQTNSSFAKYYFGAPMMTSMVTGAAMNRLPGITQGAMKNLMRRTTPGQRDAIVKGTARIAQAGATLMEQSIAAARATRIKMGSTGLTSMVSIMGQSGRNKERFGVIYSKELQRLKTEPWVYERTKKEVAAFGHSVDKELKKREPGLRKYNSYERAAETAERVKKDVEIETREGYTKQMQRPSAFMKMMNWMADNVDDKRFRTSRQTSTLPGEKGVPVDFGKYVVGGTQVDFGRMNLAFMKDIIIKGATTGRNPISGIVRLFGQTNTLTYQSSSHSLELAFKKLDSGSLYVGKTYDHNGKSFHDTINRIVGIDAEYGAPDELLATAKGFAISQRDTIARKHKLNPKNNVEDQLKIDTILQRKYAHGEIPTKQGDYLVHYPGGKLKLFTSFKDPESNSFKSISFQLGHIEKDEYLSYYKFTSQTSNKAARYFYGQEDIVMKGVEMAKAGPTQIGKVLRDETDQGLWNRIKNALDIGYSDKRWLGNKVTSVFTKKTDPRYIKTFMDRSFIGNTDFRAAIAGSEKAQMDMAQNLGREATDLMEHVVAKQTRRAGGSDAFVNMMEDSSSPSSELVKQFMLADQMTGQTAAERSAAFLEYLRSVQKGGIDPKLMSRQMSAANDIRTLFTETTEDLKVYNLLGGIDSGKTIFVNGKRRPLTKVDEYNAMVLTTIMGTTEHQNPIAPMMQTFYQSNANPKVVSEFAAASHLSQFHHKTNKIISSRYENGFGTDGTNPTRVQHSENAINDLLKLYSDPKSTEFNTINDFYKKSLRHSDMFPGDLDPRIRVEETYGQEVFAIPKGLGNGFITKKRYKDGTEIAEGIMDAGNMAVMSMLGSFNNVMSEALGLGLDESVVSTPGKFLTAMVAKRIIPGMAVYLGYNALDRFADRTMDGTPLGEGLTTFGANIFAGARVAAANVLDKTGVTDAAKYMENLMPGSIQSPLSGLARFVGPAMAGLKIGGTMGGAVGSLTGGLIGTAVGGLIGGGPLGLFGQWNIDKSRDEVINILSGREEVAIKKGRWWELGKSAFEGTRTEYFRPHAYALMRAKYKDSPGLKDSFLKDTIGALAPDLYAMQNYYSRPYPVTAGIFSDIPIVSNILSMAPGLPIGGGISMHQNDWSTRYQKGVAVDNGMNIEEIASTYGEGSGYFSSTSPGATGAEMDTSIMPIETPLVKSGFDYSLGESMANIKDVVGIRGFMLGSAYTAITGRRDLYDYAPETATPVDIAGIRRSYWDQQLGGMLGMSEIIRRYIPNRRTQMDIFNPIINAMPNWLPNEEYMTDFQHGDPYTKVTMGEARLPGSAYETIHDVDLDMPVESDILAESFDSQMAYFLGLPEYMVPRKRKEEIARNVADGVRENARKFGDLVKGDAAVYNAKLNVRATVDAIIKNGQGDRIPVKVAPSGFGGMNSLNAFLTMSEMDQGLLMEVDPDTGNVTEKMITKNANKFADDLQRTEKARWASYRQLGQMEKEGKAMNLGNAYSWFNRYKILADVAMYSKEFREADAIVQQQMSAGYLSGTQTNEYFNIKNQMKQKEKAFDFSEYRFLTLGDSLTESGKLRDAEIMKEFNPVERAVGGAWEYFSHMRTPIHSKLLHKTTALEEYERNVVYGKTMPMWDNPYEDYLKSYAYQMVAEDDPVQGALSWGIGGMLLGGFPMAGYMSSMGAMIGGANAVSGNVFIPERVNSVRSIMEQADAVEYARYINEYNETGDKRNSVKAARTMTGSIMNGKILDPMVASSALGGQDKAYFEDIISNVTRQNLDKVAQTLPREALPVLYNEIGDTKQATNMAAQLKNELSSKIMPGLDSSIYDSAVPLEIPSYKTFEMEGANAHDAGLGWYNQISAMNRLKAIGKYKDETLFADAYAPQHSLKDLQKTLNATSKLRANLRKISTNVNIIEDGSDSIDVEIIM